MKVKFNRYKINDYIKGVTGKIEKMDIKRECFIMYDGHEFLFYDLIINDCTLFNIKEDNVWRGKL